MLRARSTSRASKVNGPPPSSTVNKSPLTTSATTAASTQPTGTTTTAKGTTAATPPASADISLSESLIKTNKKNAATPSTTTATAAHARPTKTSNSANNSHNTNDTAGASSLPVIRDSAHGRGSTANGSAVPHATATAAAAAALASTPSAPSLLSSGPVGKKGAEIKGAPPVKGVSGQLKQHRSGDGATPSAPHAGSSKKTISHPQQRQQRQRLSSSCWPHEGPSRSATPSPLMASPLLPLATRSSRGHTDRNHGNSGTNSPRSTMQLTETTTPATKAAAVALSRRSPAPRRSETARSENISSLVKKGGTAKQRTTAASQKRLSRACSTEKEKGKEKESQGSGGLGKDVKQQQRHQHADTDAVVVEDLDATARNQKSHPHPQQEQGQKGASNGTAGARPVASTTAAKPCARLNANKHASHGGGEGAAVTPMNRCSTNPSMDTPGQKSRKVADNDREEECYDSEMTGTATTTPSHGARGGGVSCNSNDDEDDEETTDDSCNADNEGEEDDEYEDDDEEDDEDDDTDEDEYDDDDDDEEEGDDSDDDDCVHDFRSSSRRSREKRKHKRKSQRSGSSSANTAGSDQQQQLITKISREGDLNVKMIFINRRIKFKYFVADVMSRFGYEKPADFDMYCIDTTGDRVDIDVEDDFHMLTRSFWTRLDEATAAAAAAAAGHPTNWSPSPTLTPTKPTGMSFPVGRQAAGRNGNSTGNGQRTLKKPTGQSGTSPNATTAGPSLSSSGKAATLTTTANNNSTIGALIDPADKSSGTVIRLYVRDSHAFRQQQQQRFGHSSSSMGVVPFYGAASPTSPIVLTTPDGAVHALQRSDSSRSNSISGGGSVSAVRAKFLSAIRSSPDGSSAVEDSVLATTNDGNAGLHPKQQQQKVKQQRSKQHPRANVEDLLPDRHPLSTQGNHTFSSSGALSESQRTMYGRTFVFEVDKEVVWTKLATLGKGSFGTVYEGITSDGKIVAVKVQELPLDDDAEETKALAAEINLLRTLKHKNIVAYYGCQTKTNESRGSVKQMEIFLEMCGGGSLSQMRKRFEATGRSLAISIVRAYTKQILEGLAYLHDQNVMHRDLKSDNVLISATGEAKLADFGCSKHIGGTQTFSVDPSTNSSSNNNNGRGALYKTLVGSPFFIAPEVMLQDASGAGDDKKSEDQQMGYSMSADIWSVGCLVLELLGRDPWVFANSTNIFQAMYLISKATGMPTGMPKKCPPMLFSFLSRCFDRNPRKRATAVELLSHKWIICAENLLEEVPPDPE